MRRIASVVLFISVLSGLGLLVGQSDRAEATTSSISCGSGTTCTGNTTYFLDASGIFWTHGKSSSTGTISSAFAWIQATNIYHSGTVFMTSNCHYYSGSHSCQTSDVAPCTNDPYPAGCGAGGGQCSTITVCVYGTTWSYWVDTNGSTNYSVFTATDSGRALAYCWTNMNCF